MNYEEPLDVDALIDGTPKVVPFPGSSPQQKYNWREHVVTAAALQRMTFPPIKYVVPGLIPEGLSMLVGKPKIGKSWLALDLCIAVSSGRYCLGDKKPTAGDVLYAAMEDNPRRLQRRIDKLLSPVSAQWPDRLTLVTQWRRLDKGGVDDIRDWIESVPEARVVILDTLAGVKPIKTQQGYTEDYASLEDLHRLANEKGISIIVLHHQRKMDAEDKLDTVSGTLGLAGCADTILVLSRSSQGTTLYVRGRDVEEAEHAVTFNKDSCRWSILGDASEIHRSNERGKILDVLQGASEPMTPREVADAADHSYEAVRKTLQRMAEAGEIDKAGRGRYTLSQASHCPNER